jgi:hypothetical protein
VETHEVRMSDVGETAKLPLEARRIRRAHTQQRLERDDFVADAVVNGVDDAHPASTEAATNPVSLGAAKPCLGLTCPLPTSTRR